MEAGQPPIFSSPRSETGATGAAIRNPYAGRTPPAFPRKRNFPWRRPISPRTWLQPWSPFTFLPRVNLLPSVEDPFCLLSSSFSPCNRIVAAPVSGNPRWKTALTDSVRCTVLYHVDCFMGGESRRICFNFLPFLRKYMIIVISTFSFL